MYLFFKKVDTLNLQDPTDQWETGANNLFREADINIVYAELCIFAQLLCKIIIIQPSSNLAQNINMNIVITLRILTI